MTWTIQGYLTGEEKDADCAFYTAAALSDAKLSTAYFAAPGTRCVEFDYTIVGSRQSAIIGYGGNVFAPSVLGNANAVFSGRTTVTGAGTSSTGLPLVSSESINKILIAVGNGSDTKLRVLDSTGSVVATSLSNIAVLGTPTQWTVSFDWVNYATVYIRIYINGVQEVAVNTLKTKNVIFGAGANFLSWGYALGAGVSLGAKLYLIDAVARVSGAAGEAPHQVAYPIFRIVGGQRPTGTGFYDQWNGTISPAGNKYDNLGAGANDMAAPGAHPGNDGSGSYVGIWSGVAPSNDLKQTFTTADANPFGAETPTAITDVFCTVVKQPNGASKVDIDVFLRLGGVDLSSNSYQQGGSTTVWLGYRSDPLARPGGGAWTKSDFDPGTLQHGGKTLSAAEAGGFTIGGRVTDLPGPTIIWYKETLPIGEPPAINLVSPVQTPQGGGPVIRPHFDHLADRRATRSGELVSSVKELERRIRRTQWLRTKSTASRPVTHSMKSIPTCAKSSRQSSGWRG